LKKNIGSGTFGTVEKRQRKKDNKTFAIKVIGNVNLMMSDAIESEAKVMQMTKSDYTIDLIDYFYDEDYEGGSYIFVMPYCRDGSLSKLMQRKWEEE
jgi:serine/threonine protein kinase